MNRWNNQKAIVCVWAGLCARELSTFISLLSSSKSKTFFSHVFITSVLNSSSSTLHLHRLGNMPPVVKTAVLNSLSSASFPLCITITYISHSRIAYVLHRYGHMPPDSVFVERKTHKESWKGEESVKERFTIPEEKVVPFIDGEFGAKHFSV